MSNHPSAEKRHRQNVKRRGRNLVLRSRVRTVVRRVRESIEARNVGEATERLRHATRTIDKAVTKGVLHHNTAARKISRLARAVHALGASPG